MRPPINKSGLILLTRNAQSGRALLIMYGTAGLSPSYKLWQGYYHYKPNHCLMNKPLHKSSLQKFQWNLSVADTVALAVTVVLSVTLCYMYVKLMTLTP